ncbi:hypothetical protein [uncultured Thiodictyon sp.]|uniref:hypothetical protein n=1 Tax=uncultured Thiodictyon sp. TaxID=1846217 RepID=UPI0025FEBDCF|nr:hypothetical protein [uncultured Thiodictyon sp.]
MTRVFGLALALIAGGWLLAGFVTLDEATVSVEKDAQDDGTAPTGLAHWSELKPAAEAPP